MSSIRWFVLPLALVACAGTVSPSAAKTLAIGQPAPLRETSLKNVDGKDVTLASVSGEKGTLVIFMCNHCPWVKMWSSRIAAIGNQAQSAGIGVVGVNSNDPSAFPEDAYEEMVTRAKELDLHFPYVVDATSDLARAFGATRTPEAFLFNAKGKLVYHGTIDDNARDEGAVSQPWLREAVEAVAAGHAVKVSETKALGCSVKLREKSET